MSHIHQQHPAPFVYPQSSQNYYQPRPANTLEGFPAPLPAYSTTGPHYARQQPSATQNTYAPNLQSFQTTPPQIGMTNGPTASQMEQDPLASSPPISARPLPVHNGPQPIVYLATYSNVPVYELTIRGIAVMRRRADGFLNATQILKVAGIEKAKRTKILEKEILTGEHEKVQGGYGKYQGTWIPLKRAQELAATYNVAHLLRPVLEFDPKTADQVPTAGPKKRPNPNAPANSAYFKTGPGSQQTPASSASSPPPASQTNATKAPTQQPRFLQLRAPPGSTENGSSPSTSTTGLMHPSSASLIGALGSSASTSEGIPPGSSASMRQALSNYSQYGYSPQGVALPTPLAGEAGSSNKRVVSESAESADGGQGPSKRVRAGSATRSPPQSTSMAIGPSPVKDLAALVGPDSSLRGASHPRLHRVPLGPPDELVRKAGNARFADSPQPLKPQDEGEKRMRERLVALFMDEAIEAVSDGSQPHASTSATRSETVPPSARLTALLSELRAAVSLGGVASATDEGGPAPCVDTVIDDHGHTALHWSAALCRLSLVKTLVARSPSEGGTNIHSGNYAGETALHRSVLVTNAYDSSLFPELLQLLAPSLHTRDFKSRTVLHHIALVAPLKGRATPARYYLASVLEHIKNHEGGRFASLVDAQDEDGETALGIAARQGNDSLVKMLLEVGARKDLSNCFGLKPSDWGIDGGASASSSAGPGSAQLQPETKEGLKESRSDVVTALMRPPQAPVQKSQDVLDQMRSILDDLSTVSQKELNEKSEALQTAQSHLQSATRELTSRRRMIGSAQSKVAEAEQRKIRLGNLSRRLNKLLTSPSGSRIASVESTVGGEEASASQIAEILRHESAVTQSEDAGLDGDLALLSRSSSSSSSSSTSTANANTTLLHLRFLQRHYTSLISSLSSSLSSLSSESQVREEQCRKVVAMYSRIEETKVEAILDDLVAAVESYAEVDLARVAGFLAKTGTHSGNGRGGLNVSSSNSSSGGGGGGANKHKGGAAPSSAPAPTPAPTPIATPAPAVAVVGLGLSAPETALGGDDDEGHADSRLGAAAGAQGGAVAMDTE